MHDNGEYKIYNLRVIPPGSVLTEITTLKKRFEERYGKQKYSRSKPHITLMYFEMPSEFEKDLLAVLDRFSSVKKFKLVITGFNVFKKSKTLFLDIEKSDPLIALYDQLERAFSGLFQGKPPVVRTPHITISQTPNIEILDDSVRYFQKQNYPKSFLVNGMTLVTRVEGKTWASAYDISFG